MTRIAHLRNLASADSNDYVVYNDAKKRFELNNEKQWSNHRPVFAGNVARRQFVEALKREYPEIAQEIEPLLQQNGKPLKSWQERDDPRSDANDGARDEREKKARRLRRRASGSHRCWRRSTAAARSLPSDSRSRQVAWPIETIAG